MSSSSIKDRSYAWGWGRGWGETVLEGHIFFEPVFEQIPLRIRGKPRTLAPENIADASQHKPTTLGASQSPEKDHCWVCEEIPNFNSLVVYLRRSGEFTTCLLKQSSLKPGAVILETFERLDRLTSLQPGPRLGFHLPLLSCIVLQIPGDLSRYPGVTKPGPPWLPRAGRGLPACLQSQKSQN